MYFGTSPKISQALLGVPLRRENELGLCTRLTWSRGEGTAGSFLPSSTSFQSQGEDKGPHSEFMNDCVEGGKRRGDSESFVVPWQRLPSPTLENSPVRLEYKLPVRKSGLCPGGDAPVHNPSRKEWPALGRASVHVSGLCAGLARCQVWDLQCSQAPHRG